MDASATKKNNFDLVRLLAATLVIFDHSLPLTGTLPWVFDGTNLCSPGGLCVDVFFLTSGYLVTQSLLARRSIVQFAWARVIRIYPALLVLCALTLLLAACCTSANLLADPRAWSYALNTALPTCAQLTVYRLPGVFEANPFAGVVNGSLWTLPFELRMYAILGVLWLAARCLPSQRERAARVGILALALLGALGRVLHPDSAMANFVFMFFTGASYHVLRHRVRYRLDVAAVCVCAMACSLLYRPAFVLVYHLCIGYVLFTLAFVPRLWRPRADCSYGIYIYAFPIQQIVVALVPGVTWYQMVIATLPAAYAAGLLSWHLVEKPALRLKAWRPRLPRLGRESEVPDTL